MNYEHNTTKTAYTYLDDSYLPLQVRGTSK